MSLAQAASIKTNPVANQSLDLSGRPPSTGTSTPTLTESIEKKPEHETGKSASKTKKRGLFGLGKKKHEDKIPTQTPSRMESPIASTSNTNSRDTTKRGTTTSPVPLESPKMIPSSPGRALSCSSPRMSSPAGSQIFERDVQESALLPTSPAIPSHIQTENHIPPVLDASSEAITDDHLNPDTVEIVTHTSHQPAAVTVAGASIYESISSSWTEDFAAFSDKEESASNYGSLDSTDVRRLSFISFADVVQAEQGPPGLATGSRDSMHLAGLTSLASMGVNRSPSPIRSPVSSQAPETSPPNSKSGSVKGISLSPARKPLGSPTSTEYNLGLSTGELTIETMSQALRRTGSTDLSAARSHPISPIEGPSR
ncbi:hypothetical protein EKO27_g9401 [Xylaria grammica]|uniref:Uncharacterized protein n=1 Tax=Xylaria grammica TaxID=363999 RepID=A0A439CU66_9PEZI|nr:hypothetical protein F5X98DRAFT_341556 [Xylaria grammica]RWA05700.1 hypothetical protein EKO27_g9401 [Xylaria grammica]GAW21507.1 hypothetical protein ANO14919_110280 [Xylariales sp. No.14919]